MYLKNSKIIKEVNHYLSKEQNNYLEKIIEMAFPNSILSIDDLAYKLDAEFENVESVLIKLSEFKIIQPLFILKCDNDEFDNVHTYKFDSFKSLNHFVLNQTSSCPECNSNFYEENVEVYFKIPDAKLKKVIDHE